jgi:hypothetical protein
MTKRSSDRKERGSGWSRTCGYGDSGTRHDDNPPCAAAEDVSANCYLLLCVYVCVCARALVWYVRVPSQYYVCTHPLPDPGVRAPPGWAPRAARAAEGSDRACPSASTSAAAGVAIPLRESELR